MNLYISSNSFFDKLCWKKLYFTLYNKKSWSGQPYIITVNSIIKEVSKRISDSYENTYNIVFRIKDRNFTTKAKEGGTTNVEVLFAGAGVDIAERWKDELIAYFSEEKNSENNLLHNYTDVEEFNFCMISSCYDLSELFVDNEICLDFLTPFHFNQKKGKDRCCIDSSTLFYSLKSRFEKIFGFAFPSIDTAKFKTIPYFLRYNEIKKPSVSQGGHLLFINGCMGKLYLKGDLSGILPYLIIGTEFNAGSKISYGLGYYHLFPKPVKYFDAQLTNQSFIKYVYEEVVEELDSYEEVEGLNEDIPVKILESIVVDNYTPSPVKQFIIPKSNGGSRLIEKPVLIDLVIGKIILKLIEGIIDKAMEFESIGYRKGVSRETAVDRINIAISKGYSYIIESDIEDFFPSVEHNILLKRISDIIPSADVKTLSLIQKIICTHYFENGEEKIRRKGLSLGAPLSPLLANIYLDYFDEKLKEKESVFIRYADDFIIMTKSYEEAEELLSYSKDILADISLTVNSDKTSIKHVSKGFTFLGFSFTGDGAVSDNSVSVNPYRKPLFITEPFTFLGVSNERVDVKSGKKLLYNMPLDRISDILLLNQTSISSQLVSKCMTHGIPISLTLNSGYYITTIKPDNRNHYDMSSRHGHIYYTQSEAERITHASMFASAKIYNYINFFKTRRHNNKLFISQLENCIDNISKSSTLDEIRGFEGYAAKLTFSEINSLISVPEFTSKKRGRKENDRLNGLLNYGYYLLFSRINALVRSTGLNPYLGFLHSDINDYESLASDIEEPFRVFVDRLLVRMINISTIKPDDFEDTKGRLYLKSESRKRFLHHYELEFTNKSVFNGASIHDMINVQVLNIKRWVNEGVPFPVVRWK